MAPSPAYAKVALTLELNVADVLVVFLLLPYQFVKKLSHDLRVLSSISD